jgi:23S rRNA pseudouridine1911/1915/1917 synthase
VKTVASVPGSLLDALKLLIPGASKRTLRQMLSQGRVRVNGLACKIAAHKVRPGDLLEIGPRRIPAKLPEGLEILFEDADILVAIKPSGLLTVSTPDEKERTAFAYLSQYLKEQRPRKKLFVVHRLDKFASGVLVFAKSEPVKTVLQGVFSRHEIQRKYWAIVEGRVAENKGTIRSYLAQDQSLRMHSTQDKTRGKSAVTHFRVLRRLQDATALEVALETGRKNQIRAHLSEMGHPIVGDRAYGSAGDRLGRLGLHAFYLGFTHPTKSIPLEFQTEPPPEFLRYLPQKQAIKDL